MSSGGNLGDKILDNDGDAIEQFSATVGFDPIEQFASAATALDTMCSFSLADGAEPTVQDLEDSGQVGTLGVFKLHGDESDSLDCSVLDDGFMSNQFDGSAVDDTHADVELSSGSASLNHGLTQAAFAQSLDSQQPQFMWEQDPFLSGVFGQKNLVDELFPTVKFKRPHGALIDLTGVSDYEPPIQKALRKGQARPLFLKVIRQSTVVSVKILRGQTS